MKFSPGPDKALSNPKREDFHLNLGNSDSMLDLKLRTKKLAQKRGLSVTELVRQMLEHCLAEAK